MLKVRNLVAGYRQLAIARLEALDVAAGEAAVLAGASGAGKTTLLLALAGLADAINGEIEVNGVDLNALSARRRDKYRGRHIGLVFQDLHLVSGLTALDNMLLAPFAAGVRRDRPRALSLLKQLGLGSRIRARAETLSRGEAQRVAIGRAMLMNPILMLADEPTASLDDDACDKVLTLLEEATRECGAALIVATHDARVKARIPKMVMAEAI